MPCDIPVVVRCAHQAFPDERCSCPSEWTVLRLKEMLRDVYSNRPDPGRQRLIHCGQILKDDAQIGNCLKNFTNDPNHEAVIHLVYTPNVDEVKQRSASASPVKSARIDPSPVSAAPPVAPAPPQEARPLTGQEQFYAQQMINAQNAYAFYLNNYMAYVQQMYGVAYPLAGSVGGMPMPMMSPMPFAPESSMFGFVPPNALSGQVPLAADAAQPQPPAPVANDQPAPQEDQVMNAQGGVDQEFGERDWLEMLYMGLRGGILLMILFNYSSLSRMSFVIAIVSLLYGYQQGWFGRNVDNRNEEEAEEQVPDARNDDNNNNVISCCSYQQGWFGRNVDNRNEEEVEEQVPDARNDDNNNSVISCCSYQQGWFGRNVDNRNEEEVEEQVPDARNDDNNNNVVISCCSYQQGWFGRNVDNRNEEEVEEQVPDARNDDNNNSVISCCSYQQGWFGRNVDNRNEEEVEEQAPDARNDDNNNNVGDADDLGGQDADGQPVDNENADQPPPPDNENPQMPQNQFAGMTSWQIFWTVCYTFFTSFFASLIPERPPPIDLN